jgi:putative endonuclease
MEHIQKGIAGEQKACTFLEQQGYKIIEKNLRIGKGEIDLIAVHNNCMCFIEVKYRKHNRYGFPEEFVTQKKLLKIQETAEAYIYTVNWQGRIRFDVVAITGEELPVHLMDVTL